MFVELWSVQYFFSWAPFLVLSLQYNRSLCYSRIFKMFKFKKLGFKDLQFQLDRPLSVLLDRPLSPLLDRPLWVFWDRPLSDGPSTFRRKTVHFTLGPSTFQRLDRPLFAGPSTSIKRPSTLTQDRPLSAGPSTFDGPSTFGTVHFPHFGPSTFTPTRNNDLTNRWSHMIWFVFLGQILNHLRTYFYSLFQHEKFFNQMLLFLGTFFNP